MAGVDLRSNCFSYGQLFGACSRVCSPDTLFVPQPEGKTQDVFYTYYLADRGYDVWIGNARGTLYSRQHKHLNPDTDKAYWDFSFHEMGVHDVPAVLKYIRGETGVNKVHYIGMSMGSTMLLVMGALHPEYLDMVDCVIMLAPVARPMHMAMISGSGFYFNWAFFGTMHFLGVGEVFRHKTGPALTFHNLCNSKSWTERLCGQIMRIASPKEKDLYDFENAKDTIQYFPAGSTVKTYRHYLQIARSGRFQQYDYGDENKDHYNGLSKPPNYDLSKLKKRFYLLSGGLDNIADKKDILWLHERLPDSVLITDQFKHFSHRDFILGVNLEGTLYKTIDEIFMECKGTTGNQ